MRRKPKIDLGDCLGVAARFLSRVGPLLDGGKVAGRPIWTVAGSDGELVGGQPACSEASDRELNTCEDQSDPHSGGEQNAGDAQDRSKNCCQGGVSTGVDKHRGDGPSRR